MNELTTISHNDAKPLDAYRMSTDAAGVCRDIVVATASTIQGRKFVSVEGWQAIAIAHGCAAGSRDVERVEGGVRAIGEIRRMSDGQVIATAEGFVGEDEATWFGGVSKSGKSKGQTLQKRDDYAIRAMAQTRAISRACRSAFAHVVVMMKANLETTPAAEVPAEGFDRETGEIIEATPERQKVPGIHKIKERLRTLMTDGGAATSLDDFNALVSQHKTDLETIKEHQHEWWTGDGDDFEGFRTFIKRRREELDVSEDFRMCLETLEACTSAQELDAWFKLNSKYVETLDGDESRRIQTRYDELEAGLKAAAVVRA